MLGAGLEPATLCLDRLPSISSTILMVQKMLTNLYKVNRHGVGHAHPKPEPNLGRSLKILTHLNLTDPLPNLLLIGAGRRGLSLLTLSIAIPTSTHNFGM